MFSLDSKPFHTRYGLSNSTSHNMARRSPCIVVSIFLSITNGYKLTGSWLFGFTWLLAK